MVEAGGETQRRLNIPLPTLKSSSCSNDRLAAGCEKASAVCRARTVCAPSVAARLLGAFEIWRKLDDTRQALIKTELERVIAAKPSKNVLEIAEKTLGA